MESIDKRTLEIGALGLLETMLSTSRSSALSLDERIERVKRLNEVYSRFIHELYDRVLSANPHDVSRNHIIAYLQCMIPENQPYADMNLAVRQLADVEKFIAEQWEKHTSSK